jgi:hypothetical protein
VGIVTDNVFLHPQADELGLALWNRRQLEAFLSGRPGRSIDRDVVLCAVLVVAAVVLGRMLGGKR